jgi:parallel beta-helix repeat protein
MPIWEKQPPATIQGVIDATPTGGFADLKNYQETNAGTITVDRPMAIIGGDIDGGAGTTPVVNVTADHLQISGMRLTATGTRQLIKFSGNFGTVNACQLSGYAGIVLDSTATYCVVTSNVITNVADNGIYMSSGRHCTISNNVIHGGVGHSGIKARGWGITITNNVIYDMPIGITVTGNDGSEFPDWLAQHD